MVYSYTDIRFVDTVRSSFSFNDLNKVSFLVKAAYLYVRVSTDEQKRKGYSLPEQEDRLLKYCESNNIQVKV